MTQRHRGFGLWLGFPFHPLSSPAGHGGFVHHPVGEAAIERVPGGPRKPPAKQAEAKRLAARRRHERVPDEFDSWLDRSLKDLFNRSPGDPLPPELKALLAPPPDPKPKDQ